MSGYHKASTKVRELWDTLDEENFLDVDAVNMEDDRFAEILKSAFDKAILEFLETHGLTWNKD